MHGILSHGFPNLSWTGFILGAEGVLAPGAADTPFGGKFEHDFRAAVVTTVYGGASEILREIIAERRLGLPRNRPAS